MLSGSRIAIDRALQEFLSEATSQLNAIDSNLAPMSQALSQFLNGGKRLRPLFAVAGYIAAGGSLDHPASPEASAFSIYRSVVSLELLQACALIHDDMMDGSDTRRGAPAMHRRFENEHRERAGVGNSTDFGSSAALLLGDLALVLSNQVLNNSGLSAEQARHVHPIFDTMKVELMAGQYLDMYAGSQERISLDEALKIAIYKSGKYTIERPLHFGGALALCRSEMLELYSDYGIPLGVAFQLRDDLLGVFGDTSVTGKPAGDDLLEGKRTALISYALENLTEGEVKEFIKLFGDRSASADAIERMRALIHQSGAVNFIEKLIDERTNLALRAAADSRFTAEGRELLAELAIAATRRSA